MSKKYSIIKTQYGSFRCVFEVEKDMGGYMAEAIGVPGAITWGKTLPEAKRMMTEAIEGAIEAKAVAAAEKRGIVRINKPRSSLVV